MLRLFCGATCAIQTLLCKSTTIAIGSSHVQPLNSEKVIHIMKDKNLKNNKGFLNSQNLSNNHIESKHIESEHLQAIISPKLLATDINTTCPYCGVGCGVRVSKLGETIDDASSVVINAPLPVLINGDKHHPANFGKLCIKGKNLGDTLMNDNRLVQPKIHNKVQKWPKTLDYVASRLAKTIEEYGPDSVAFYTSGQLLTEDYYLANKLMKGFIGSGNIDTNSRLCMSSAVSAHKRAFGEDIVPISYSDIIKADLIVLTGSNLAWCHPVIYQRIRNEKEKRPELKIVVIDPRVTASTELADLHLAIKAGGDLSLFNGLLNYLSENGCINGDALTLAGLDDALQSAKRDSAIKEGQLSGVLLDKTGLSITDINEFYQLFAHNDKVVTIFSQGINQSVQGTDQGNAIINCHLASGKIGKAGSGPFSITGQPNAMGGREVGALANTLASHIDFPNATTDLHKYDELHKGVADFWQTDCLVKKEGLKAVDLFNAVAEGKIKAIWIMATNPIVSMPNHQKIAQALSKCPLVIVSDCVESNDTLPYADVILPAQAWGEKSGTVTNSERRISRQRPFLIPFGEAKPDWWIISEVAKRMGFAKQFSYNHVSEVFAEHARLSGLQNEGSRAFDISAYGNITAEQYELWQPVQWPQPKGQTIRVNDQGFFNQGRYYHGDKKAKMIAVASQALFTLKASTEKLCNNKQHNEKTNTKDQNGYDASNTVFTLNTGRNRDQWHTQTRTGKSSILTNRHPEPEVSINPKDALALGIKEAQLVTVSALPTEISEPLTKSLAAHQSPISAPQLVMRVKLTGSVSTKTLFMPIHWSKSNFNQGCISQLVQANVDKISGQPAFKHSQVNIKPCQVNSEALLVVKTVMKMPIEALDVVYHVEQKIAGGYCYHLASNKSPEDFFNTLDHMVRSQHITNQCIDNLNASEPLKQYFRKSYLSQGQLQSAILVSPNKSDLPQGWISQCYQLGDSINEQRDLLSNDAKQLQQKKTFCQCLNIELNQVTQAIEQGDLTVASIRANTGAGNGCGSCIGDISLMLKELSA
ncbi:MAG: assimilatory nitrate reductase catalytic subunit [Alteromonadaceae bacterium]|jgi:assimilatory nitrate reductase catalytic subunit